jgi:hypothetical protein
LSNLVRSAALLIAEWGCGDVLVDSYTLYVQVDANGLDAGDKSEAGDLLTSWIKTPWFSSSCPGIVALARHRGCGLRLDRRSETTWPPHGSLGLQ